MFLGPTDAIAKAVAGTTRFGFGALGSHAPTAWVAVHAPVEAVRTADSRENDFSRKPWESHVRVLLSVQRLAIVSATSDLIHRS